MSWASESFEDVRLTCGVGSGTKQNHMKTFTMLEQTQKVSAEASKLAPKAFELQRMAVILHLGHAVGPGGGPNRRLQRIN